MSEATECRFCGKASHGYGCIFSPNGIHKAIGDNDHCIYCGTTNYGKGCVYSKEDKTIGLHIHGHGKSSKDNKHHCIYCGSLNHGEGCIHSPSGRHQF